MLIATNAAANPNGRRPTPCSGILWINFGISFLLLRQYRLIERLASSAETQRKLFSGARFRRFSGLLPIVHWRCAPSLKRRGFTSLIGGEKRVLRIRAALKQLVHGTRAGAAARVGIVAALLSVMVGGPGTLAQAAVSVPSASPLAVVVDGFGLAKVFDVIDGVVYVRDGTDGNSVDGEDSWGPWMGLDGGIGQVTTLAAQTDKDGNTELFALTSTGAIYARSSTCPKCDAMTPWQSFDGNLNSIALVKYFDGRLELFGTNSAGQVFHRGQWPNSLSWSNWETLDGSLKAVSAAINTDGRV